MITLNNVTKTYTSKSKNTVDALRGVSFELGDRGMVFILGKSGSGKSTLLNLLGGLDSATSGDIVVDGVSMKDFKQADYDSYRNGYVGFVFQEYNLLDDFNVKDNVALSLQLSNGEEIDNKVIEALKQVELTEDYLSRRTGEMSGGEKQRIAIARCIVKDSHMILADEPTGNLDSATGESIWNILKTLSQSKLVVVVSHDRESAEKYGDRVIEIADGLVISDNGEQPATEREVQPYVSQKKQLSNKVIFKLGAKNMGQRKVKTVSVILLSIFSILALLLSEMFVAYSPERTISDFVNKHNVPYTVVYQVSRLEATTQTWKQNTVDYIANNSKYIKDNVVESKQQVLDFGFTFVGEALELTSNSYYITSEALESGYGRGIIIVDGEEQRLVKDYYPPETLIGQQVYFDNYLSVSNGNYPTLAGIIDSDSMGTYAMILDPIFAKYDFESLTLRRNLEYDPNLTLDLNGGTWNKPFVVKCPANEYESGRVITADGEIVNITDMELADDEIVMSFDLLQQTFEVGHEWDYISGDLFTLYSVPPQIGQTISMKLYDKETGELAVELGDVKLAGVMFWRTTSTKESIHVGEQHYRILSRKMTANPIIIKNDSTSNYTRFLSTLRRIYGSQVGFVGEMMSKQHEAECASIAYGFESDVFYSVMLSASVCVIMCVVLVLLVINLISFSITNRKKEIGILSALGTSNKDITKIFLVEVLIIATISFVVTLCALFGVIALLNWYYSTFTKALVPSLVFFRVDVLTIALIFVASYGLLLLAALIPIRKISKIKPIDAIRNV